MNQHGKLSFRKLQGCGNSFVVVRTPAWRAFLAAHETSSRPAIVRRLCSPGFGIGADGVLAVGAVHGGSVDVEMWNPDGSEMGMCGNGVRCVMRTLFLDGDLRGAASELAVAVGPRTVTCRTETAGEQTSVDFGPVRFDPAEIPCVAADTRKIEVELGDGMRFEAAAASVGNPHCIIEVEALSEPQLIEYGPQLENHPIFPERTNVEFVQRVSSDRVRILVWERGAGATLACGTAAAATVAALHRAERVGRRVEVELPGGMVSIELVGPEPRAVLHGPAKEICKGELEGRL